MSLPSKSDNAILRALFEQRLDTLRNNIISFIGNALKDETVNILNESDTTRAFVVDRILEVVSENLESEKETTIYKLIQNVNDRQKVIDDNADQVKKLKESVSEKESKIKSQADKIKYIENELKIKIDQIEKQQTQTGQQQEQIQNLHKKLENVSKNLQDQQTKLDEQCTENEHGMTSNKGLINYLWTFQLGLFHHQGWVSAQFQKH